MMQRTSIVDHIRINTLSFSSIFEIGDVPYIQGYSRAIADQRQKPLFRSDEGSFRRYPIFREPIPLPPIDEAVAMEITQVNPVIKVHDIDVLGASSSSIVQLGNSKNIFMESRIKHIRHVTSNDNPQNSDVSS
ncbi:spore germination protein GerPE [Cytobacillus gottheilii]|uniref:spore germination protein GerPE n=1 Tax=Cytobacillus gottheilii TaxID=859144 RepID=UPI0009BAE864|nr:spore germination protein GerPE [Cytobacillus gottheilii]